MVLEIKGNRRSSAHKQAAIEEATREEVTRLNVWIPESLHRNLRLQAVAEGKGATITAIIVRAAQDYLSQHGDDLIK